MMGRCPLGGGKRDKQCASLEVEDEVECQCGCSKHLQQQCDQRRESHTWSSESCECQCKDQDAKRQCLETPGKVWDSSSCTCICQAPDTCHTGLIYNSATCVCEPTATISSEEASAVVRGDRDSAEDTNFIYNYIHQHWIELIIIIIASLLLKLYKLKTMITKGVRVETDSDGTDSYLAASPDNQSDDDNDDVADIKQRSLHLTVKNTGYFAASSPTFDSWQNNLSRGYQEEYGNRKEAHYNFTNTREMSGCLDSNNGQEGYQHIHTGSCEQSVLFDGKPT